MLKTINGIKYMTGTSEGSLYPVCLWHDNGVKIGVRFEVQCIGESKTVYVLSLYSRIQMFDIKGNDQTLDYEALAEAVKGMELRIASSKHMSGSLASGMAEEIKEGTLQQKANQFGELYAEQIIGLAKKYNLECLMKNTLIEIGKERFINQTAPDESPDEASVEQQMSESFDFKSMLAKPSPSQD